MEGNNNLQEDLLSSSERHTSLRKSERPRSWGVTFGRASISSASHVRQHDDGTDLSAPTAISSDNPILQHVDGQRDGPDDDAGRGTSLSVEAPPPDGHLVKEEDDEDARHTDQSSAYVVEDEEDEREEREARRPGEKLTKIKHRAQRLYIFTDAVMR